MKEIKRFPLQVHIALLFLLLLTAVTALLIWHNQSGCRRIILTATDTLVDHIADQVSARLSATHGPAYMAIAVLGQSRLTRAATTGQRVAALPLMAQVLAEQPYLSAVRIAYPNGDSFILRRAEGPDAPVSDRHSGRAAYVADDFMLSEGHGVLHRRFYDRHLRMVKAGGSEPARYDPRNTDWYRRAMAGQASVLVGPHPLAFIGKPGMTVARQGAVKGVVVAADITLAALSLSLPKEVVTPSSEMALFDDQGRVVAYRGATSLGTGGSSSGQAVMLDDLDDAPLAALANLKARFGQTGVIHLEVKGMPWSARLRRIPTGDGQALDLAVLVPDNELVADALHISEQGAAIGLGIVLASVPLLLVFARRLSLPLRRLVVETGRIQRFDFGDSALPPSRILEVWQLEKAILALKGTINRFLHLIGSLAGDQDFDHILETFSKEIREASRGDAVGVMLLDDQACCLIAKSWATNGKGWKPPAGRLDLNDDQARPLREVIEQKKGRAFVVEPDSRNWFRALRPGSDKLQVYLQPLLSRGNQPLGVVFLMTAGNVGNDQRTLSNWRHFVDRLSGFAAVTLETRSLLDSRKALLEGFIRVIAAAIDTKSPYTGGHCQRVPVLAQMLSQAAAESHAHPFMAYHPDDEQREALQIAAWLHDCGKVTTPEFVVDKATRLETLYNRIHEIRTRFEVLKRDACIRYWKGVAQGKEKALLKVELEKELAVLDKEFAFVAACNSGEETMTPDKQQRLRVIGNRTWTRTLDDTLGLSQEERKRKGTSVPPPIEEPLLADREEHLVPWGDQKPLPENDRWRFHMEVPEHRLNLGELHNLTIRWGTLSEEERFLINQHIVQTMVMLGQLPYPPHLKEVPEIAGAHHEKMDGTGYPLGLKGREIPFMGRIMAIADIFEALTASDRPYKPAKKLSEAVRILWFMKKDGHIDPDLFDLFLRSGVYRRYAEAYLKPEQLDEVRIEDYLA